MKKQNEIQSKLTRLQEILTGNQYKLPLFVRFKTVDRCFIVPVNKVEINKNAVKVFNGNPDVLASYVELEKIVSIDGFCDSQRTPFFLRELDDPDEILVEEISNSQE